MKCIEDNSDVIVGIKIRLSESISNGGLNEAEAYRFLYSLFGNLVLL